MQWAVKKTLQKIEALGTYKESQHPVINPPAAIPRKGSLDQGVIEFAVISEDLASQVARAEIRRHGVGERSGRGCGAVIGLAIRSE